MASSVRLSWVMLQLLSLTKRNRRSSPSSWCLQGRHREFWLIHYTAPASWYSREDQFIWYLFINEKGWHGKQKADLHDQSLSHELRTAWTFRQKGHGDNSILWELADNSHHFVWVHSFYSSDNMMTKCSFNISVIHPFLSHCSALTKFPVSGKVLA